MNYTALKICLLIFVMLGSKNILAQTEEVSLTSGGFTVVQGDLIGTSGSFQSTKGTSLNGTTLNFGDLTVTGRLSRGVVIKMPIRISALKPYKVELEALPSNMGGVKLSEIGFSIENIRLQSSKEPKWTSDATNIAVADSRFLSSLGALRISNGIPQFESTLDNLPPVIFTGVPTVGSGSIGEDGNSILMDLKFVMVEQFYTPGSFNFNLILKISPLS